MATKIKGVSLVTILGLVREVIGPKRMGEPMAIFLKSPSEAM